MIIRKNFTNSVDNQGHILQFLNLLHQGAIQYRVDFLTDCLETVEDEPLETSIIAITALNFEQGLDQSTMYIQQLKNYPEE